MRSKALSKISVLLILMLLVTGCSTTGNQAPAETDSPSDENAATYPEQPVTVIIQAAAGGGTDIMARLLFSFVEKELGVPFVCENHPGAGAQVGYTKLTQSEPDGYTIGGTNTMSIVTHELTRDVPYKLKEDFQPLFRVVFDPSAVFVRADSPFTTIEELLDYATNNPEELSWGGTFLWGAHHVHLEMVHRATDAIFTYVPFDGAAETRAAILGDHIDVAAGGASEYLELVESGELRPLVIAGNERWAPLPDVPTYKELGYDIIIGSDRGFSAPAGTSRERADILAETVKKVLEDPEFLAEAEKIGIKSILAYMDVDTWTNYLYELQDTMAEFMKSGVSS